MTYLCGGINGLSDADCRDWRTVATEALHTGILDPMRRDYRGREDECFAEIVEGDCADIDASAFLLVNATKPSWGTAMEVHYAYSTRNQVIVAWVGSGRVSPWLRYHCHELHETLEAAIASINSRAATA